MTGTARRGAEATIDGDTAVFTLDGENVTRVRPIDVQKLYHVPSGDDFGGGGEDFWVFVLADSLLVVPETTNNFYDNIIDTFAWRPWFYEEPRIIMASCWVPPRAWRRRKWCLPTLKAKLSRQPCASLTDALKEWTVEDEPRSYPEMPLDVC